MKTEMNTIKSRTNRAAMMLFLVVMATATAWAQDNNWSSFADENSFLFKAYDGQSIFVIRTAEEFANFAMFVNFDEGHDFSDKTVKLDADIDLSAHLWDLLIGYDDNYHFKGTFDGNGKTIKGLVTPEDYYDYGLFGYSEGTVKNVILDASCRIFGRGDLGGIVNYNFGIVENCVCAATLATEDDCNVGGIVGTNKGTIRGCYFLGPYSEHFKHFIYGNDDMVNIEDCYYYDADGSHDDKASYCTRIFCITVCAPCTITAVSSDNTPDGFYLGNKFYVTRDADVTLDEFADLPHIVDGYGQEYSYCFDMPECDLTVVLGNGATFSGGCGMADDPFLIKTSADLDALSTNVGEGCSYQNVFFRLEKDIDYTPDGLSADESNFTPIGDSDSYFSGVFDGNGKNIRGLRIRCSALSEVGLFRINNGTIKNLKLEDAEISGDDFVGGFVGTNYGCVENCIFHGTLSGSSIVGGVVGRNYNGTISGCCFLGTYSEDMNHAIWGISYNGPGENCYFYDPDNSNYASDCTQLYCISLIGNCTITAVDGDGNSVGLRVGQKFYVMADATVMVDGLFNGFRIIDQSGDDLETTDNQFTMCSEDVTITIDGEIFYNGLGTEDAPFIIETTDDLNALATYVNNGFYSKAFFRLEDNIYFDTSNLGDDESNFTSIGNSLFAFEGSFDGNGYCIFGLRIRTSTLNNIGLFGNNGGIVKNLEIQDAVFVGNDYVGGIAGKNDGSIENCLFMAQSVSGREYVGGIAGINNGTVRGCYCSPEIIGLERVGGIVGHNGGSIADCFFEGAFSGNDNGWAIAGTYDNSGSIVNSYAHYGNFDEVNRKAVLLKTGGDIVFELGDATATYEKTNLTAYGSMALKILDYYLYSGKDNEIPLSYSGSDLIRVDTGADDTTVADHTLTVGVADINVTAQPVSITIPTQHYDGTAKTPTVISDDGALDAQGRFTVATDDDCILPGDYTVTVFGHSDCFGSTTAPFTIDLHDVKMADDADNTEIIDLCLNYDNLVNMMLDGRTFYRDGGWNTLCLPFALNDGDANQEYPASTGGLDGKTFTGTPFEGTTVMELDGETSNLTDGTLTLNFKNATDIEAGRPYIIKWTPDLIISAASEWDAFAESVSNGKTYEGQWVRLTADINVSTMVGSEGHPFKGTFDGSGHTLTVSIEHNNVTEGTALFYSIDGATIRNVKVEGAVTGSFRPATFTSFVGGNSTIKNCWSNVTVKSTVSGNWVDGGAFVARVNTGSTLNMTDCAFTGSIIYNTIVLASAYEGGGMVGWTQDGSTAKLTNCVFAPSSFLCIRSDDNSYVFVSGIVRGELTNCYYNAVAADSYLKHEGTDASEMSSADLLAVLGDGWMVSGDNVVANTSVDIDIVNPMFYDVTIDDSTEALARQTVSFTGGQFVGVYSPVILTPNDASNLFLGADNTLYWPNAANNADGNYYVNACRAYFHIGNGAAVREFRLRFDEDPLTGGGYLGENETTGIIDVEADSSRFTHHSSLSEWYTLDGQKLDGQPTKKGLYIHGKKKVMVP